MKSSLLKEDKLIRIHTQRGDFQACEILPRAIGKKQDMTTKNQKIIR